MGVTCPIKVLNAKETMVAIITPLDRVLVSKISAGMIHESGPQAALKETLYAQVVMMKPQAAALLPFSPGGNLASKMVATMKVHMFTKLPPMRVQRRPM